MSVILAGSLLDRRGIYDLELVNLQGSPGPTWNVFEPETGRYLFSLNATNGEEAQNPRG